LNEAYHVSRHKELGEKWALVIYESDMALNVVKHPAFISSVKSMSTTRFYYVPPRYHTMQTTYIESKMKQVEAKIK
jgi:hypothetical protein